MKKYNTKNLTIGWEPEKCIHSALCAKGLSAVFNPKAKPWINVDGADEISITNQIDKCPSGALSYTKGIELPIEKPVVAGVSPVILELEKNKKLAWCSCGKSNNQPWCDGAHKGSGLSPKVFEVEETKAYALCMCKKTSNGPFCDGSHSKV